MKTMLFRSCAVMALAIPGTAFAQSVGTVDFEGEEIVVTGSRESDVAGVQVPDTSKARQVLTQELIERQSPGQTILDTINVVPGVNFTNNDAYGSAGGELTIRGFSSDRISLTFDGVPLNDSGNYQIYSNQQIDPELIDNVNVNLGTTDIDSPTASATGSTVNYRTKAPDEELGAMLSASYGDFDFHRVFGKLELGDFTGLGTRAFVSASVARNDNPFNNYGKVRKQQYNAKIHQDLGGDDFISIAGHYNENRNNFFGSVPLRNLPLTTPVPGRFPQTRDEREYDINFPCTTAVAARPGVADAASTCGTEFDRRYNPSNTGNVRVASRFGLTDRIVLTVEPSFQYVKANGGGTVGARERLQNGLTGFIGGRPYFGSDLNGDGDLLDEVTVLAPNQTTTRRWGLISNLIFEMDDRNTFRVGYTYDRARHRQTGQAISLDINGEPLDVFPINDPLLDATGEPLQRRDRLSFATLNKVFGEYRGEFDNLDVTLGLSAPFFKRDLNNYCFTTSVSGFVDCFGRDDPRNAIYAAANPTVQGPQRRVLKYDKILPNVGLVYRTDSDISLFFNYSKALQVPGTDALYNSFFFAPDADLANPVPETSDNFDLGVRYTTRLVQAQLTGWYTRYSDRLATAYDVETDRNVYRNLGRVDKYGIDGSVAFQPLPQLSLYAFGSYLWSEIKDDLQIATVNGQGVFAPTAGKREAGAPVYTYGGTIRTELGPVEIGLTGKRTGGRYIYDTNLPLYGLVPNAQGVNQVTQIYGARTPAYWLVNLDASVALDAVGLERSRLQLNVYNLFDKLYVGRVPTGGFQSGVLSLNPTAPQGATTFGTAPNAQIGAPRTISATFTVAF